MKTKLRTPAAILAFILSLATVAGQAINPTTGLPQAPYQTGQITIDPATGLPVAPQPEWRDPNWKDPDIVLTNIAYDNVPLAEVARDLRSRFKEQFDVILPVVSPGWPEDWVDDGIQLRLKDVTASEVFNAMNLMFENNRTPLRWDLKVIGHRQIALLRVLVDPGPPGGAQAPGGPIQRRVYFVGDLIGDGKDGGMTMEQIVKTITEVWQMSDTANGNIQFHKDAQLLVVSGTPSQIGFLEQTLQALQQKLNLARKTHSKPDESQKQ